MRNQRVHYLALPSASIPRRNYQALCHTYGYGCGCGYGDMGIQGYRDVGRHGICMACYSPTDGSADCVFPLLISTNFCQLVGEYVAPASLLFGPKSQHINSRSSSSRSSSNSRSSKIFEVVFLGLDHLTAGSQMGNGMWKMENGIWEMEKAVAASLEWLLMSCSLMQFINVLKWPANQMHNVCLIPDLFRVCRA